MPIVIDKNLPAYKILSDEKIFVMHDKRANKQDIRPIEIAIVNLMPTKIETETQLMRLLGNSPLQVNITLIKMNSYQSKNTSKTHLDQFYKGLDELQDRCFDGMIITGAPVEQFEYTDVAYWEELEKVMDYADKKVTSTIFICWGAQAALHYYYGIEKIKLDKKLFGIYKYRSSSGTRDMLLKGLDDEFDIPMSRHTDVDWDAVKQCPHIKILAQNENGPSIIKSKDKKIFLLGHSEYDVMTLDGEYRRDLEKGIAIDKPVNYYIEGTNKVNCSWRSTANLLFYNWLNYYVYQITPYEIEKVKSK